MVCRKTLLTLVLMHRHSPCNKAWVNTQRKLGFLRTALVGCGLLFACHSVVLASAQSTPSSEATTEQDAATEQESTHNDGEKQVVFYASYGYTSGDQWHIPFKLWVSEHPDVTRRLVAKSAQNFLRDKAGLTTLSDQQRQRYNDVMEDFIADSESREVVAITFTDDPAQETFVLEDDQGNSKTDRNGNLQGTFVLSQARAQTLLSVQDSSQGWLRFSVVSKRLSGVGRVRLISPVGLSVISDIDDTIKDTGITKGHDVVVKNTFFEAFKHVPCMVDLYSNVDSDVAFHYVSGAPWQLYAPLYSFLFTGSRTYPQGSMHMKNVRTNLTEPQSYTDFWKLISQGSQQTTYEQKISQITQLIAHFPLRQFVLVGDSGERDPEVFAEIRKRFPEHVDRIVIRNLDNQLSENSERFSNMNIIAGDASLAKSCPSGDVLFP